MNTCKYGKYIKYGKYGKYDKYGKYSKYGRATEVLNTLAGTLFKNCHQPIRCESKSPRGS